VSSGPSPFRSLLASRASRRSVIAAYLLVAAFAAPGVLRLHIDDSPERFFVHDARALERFRQLELRFGRDRAVRFALSGPGLWTHEGLAFAGALEERSQALRGVLGSAGVARHHRWRFAGWPPPDPRRFRRELVDNPIDRNAGWVAADGSTITILVGLYRLSPERRRATLAELEELAAAAPPGVDVRVAGLAVVNRELDDAVVRMARRFFPALLAVAVLLLALVFRTVAGVVLPLLVVGVCQSAILGAMGYAGQPFDLVLIILVPLLFVIVLATAVHVLCFHRRMRHAGLEPLAATLATYRVKTWPVIWTGATTAIGFGSLAVSGVQPVRALGLWSAFGMAFSTLAMLTLLPALLTEAAGVPGPARGHATDVDGTGARGRADRTGARGRADRTGARGRADRTGARGRALATAAVERPVLIAVLFAALGALALAGLPRLRFEADAISSLPESAPARSGLAALERRGIGTVAASLVLHGHDLGAPDALRRLSALARELRREPLILGALSAGDLVADVAEQLEAGPGEPGPESRARRDASPRDLAAARARIDREPDLERMLELLVTPDGRWARITLMLPARGAEVLEPLFERVSAAAARAFPETESWVTGQFPLVLAALKTLLRTMVLSLSVTALCVALIFYLVLGSLSLAVRALVPNLWPVLVVLGTMGWLGVPIESATVAIASVVLGLAVDDTLHSLGSFRRLVASGPSGTEPTHLEPTRGAARAAAIGALEETAGAHVLTSVTLALGFGVCGLSELVPVARFGALSALAILAALAADLVLVPVLLARAPRQALDRLTRRTGLSGPR